MRSAILIMILLLANEAVAQEQRPADRYGRPASSEDAQPQESAEPLGGIVDMLKKFIPSPQPGEQPIEGAAATMESVDTERKALWDAATKLKADEKSETETTSQPQVASPHAREVCLDPEKFQPGSAGYLDYYLFEIVDTGSKEVYLRLEDGKQPFCLTNVDSEDLEKDKQAVVLGNVRVRGTKTYKTDAGDKLTVRVVKLLSEEESEAVEAERALESTNHPMRAWTSKDGKYKIEARFVKFAGGKVHLVNKAGKNVSISPNDLSVADRDYYRDLIKKAREAARKKTEKEADTDDQQPAGGERELLR